MELYRVRKYESVQVYFKLGAPATAQRAWFLKIVPVWMSVATYVCMFVCVRPKRLLITSGVMWQDTNPMYMVG